MGYPVEVDFVIIQGDDFVWEFEFEDENCDPIVLSGTYFAQIRRKGVLIADFDVTYTGNVVTVRLDSTITQDLVSMKGAKWDLENQDGGVITTNIGGEVEIMEDVTDLEVS